MPKKKRGRKKKDKNEEKAKLRSIKIARSHLGKQKNSKLKRMTPEEREQYRQQKKEEITKNPSLGYVHEINQDNYIVFMKIKSIKDTLQRILTQKAQVKRIRLKFNRISRHFTN